MKNNTKTLLFILLFFGIMQITNAQVAVNTDGTSANSSAMLDVKSNNKGLLIPRLALSATNNTSPVTSPADGLLVYNTATAGSGATAVSPGFYFWNGSAWAKYARDSEVWKITGNTNTTNGTHFIGTTNAQNLDIRTNNVIRVRITQKGQIETLNTGNSVFVGEGAGANDDLSDKKNTFIGRSAASSNTIGENNIAIGYNSLLSNSTGGGNIAIGNSALETQSYANGGVAWDTYNVAVGSNALYSNQPTNNGNGMYNTAMGYNSLYSNTTGTDNIATGYQALYHNTTAESNLAHGSYALFENTDGSFNVASGGSAMYYSHAGNEYNTAVGYRAMGGDANYDNTTYNTAIGSFSLHSINGGGFNSALGFMALYNNTTAGDNSAFGSYALYSNTTAVGNSAFGSSALYNNTAGDNSAFGSYALYSNTTAIGNSAFGTYALYSNTTGTNNTATGYQALYNNTASFNTAVGYQAAYSNTGGFPTVAVGTWALYANTTGIYNSAVGYQTLYNNTTGVNNTAIGHTALLLNITGNNNTAVGTHALDDVTTGSGNTAVGRMAGDDTDSGITNCTFIGFNANADGAGTAYDNSMALGYNAQISGSNQVHIGNTSITEIKGQTSFTTYSDARVKTNITENVKGLEFILKLRPVTYNFDIDKENALMGIKSEDFKGKYDIEKIKFSGFLAQEVEQVAKEVNYNFSGIKKPKNKNQLYGLSYSEFVVPLVKAVQEQQKTIENQKNEIKLLKEQNNKQNNQIQELIKRLDILENK